MGDLAVVRSGDIDAQAVRTDRHVAGAGQAVNAVNAILEELALGEIVGIGDDQGLPVRVDAVERLPVRTGRNTLQATQLGGVANLRTRRGDEERLAVAQPHAIGGVNGAANRGIDEVGREPARIGVGNQGRPDLPDTERIQRLRTAGPTEQDIGEEATGQQIGREVVCRVADDAELRIVERLVRQIDEQQYVMVAVVVGIADRADIQTDHRRQGVRGRIVELVPPDKLLIDALEISVEVEGVVQQAVNLGPAGQIGNQRRLRPSGDVRVELSRPIERRGGLCCNVIRIGPTAVDVALEDEAAVVSDHRQQLR